MIDLLNGSTDPAVGRLKLPQDFTPRNPDGTVQTPVLGGTPTTPTTSPRIPAPTQPLPPMPGPSASPTAPTVPMPQPPPRLRTPPNESSSFQPSPAPANSATTPPPGGSYGNPIYDQIAYLYKQASGGAYTPTYADVSQWGTNVDYNYMYSIGNAIKNWWNQYTKQTAPTTTGTPTPTADYLLSLINGGLSPQDAIAQFNRATGRTTGNEAVYYGPEAHGGVATIGLPDAYLALGADGKWTITPRSGGGGGGASSGAPTTAGGSVFSDPATVEWEHLVRSLVDRLNQPQQNPDFGPLVDYMRQYFQQLQGPAYTPAQMGLMQTQALDPITQQRDAVNQQIIQNFAARGIPPSSGLVQKALQDSAQQFERLRTQTQAQFANQAISQDQQNHQLAASIGASLAALQQQQFATNEQRAAQALQTFSAIPALADSRLAAATSLVNANNVNPANLLSLIPSFQREQAIQQQQSTDYYNNIGQLVANIIANL